MERIVAEWTTDSVGKGTYAPFVPHGAEENNMLNGAGCVLTGEALLEHWQGHRRLTRRVIERFPEDKLFTFSVGRMRPFGALACEFVGITMPVVNGLLTGTWSEFKFATPADREELLELWDEQTKQLTERFPQIPVEAFGAVHNAFGRWPMTGIALVQYAIENEIHHRGQGYVYLRALGVEPPAFPDRS